MGELKHCPHCNRDLPPEAFNKNSGMADGLCYICKECKSKQKAKAKETKAEREREKEERRKLLEEGYQICLTCGRKLPIEAFSRKKSTDEKRLRHCKECVKIQCNEYWAKYRAERREANALYAREYRKTHKEQDREWRKKYVENRKKTDAFFNFKTNLSAEIYRMFRRAPKQRSVKNCKLAKILGISGKEFYEYLLKTFSDRYGREWDGVEKVHIDHIIPLVTAKTEEDIIKLNHYTNLQLLTPEDNMAKGEQIDWVKPKEDKK